MSLLHYKNITLEKILCSNDAPKKTKIVCTIGRQSDVKFLKNLIDAGMNVARLNLSHGGVTDKEEAIKNIRKACEETGQIVAILLDTKGPEIRTGFLEEKMLKFNTNDEINIITDDYDNFKGDKDAFACSYKALADSVTEGDSILAADGSLVMQVIKVNKKEKSIRVRLKNAGVLGERKNMNLPGRKVDLPILTDQDKVAISTLADKIDFVAASFIQNEGNYKEIRQVLGEKGRNVHIIAKIENQEGLKNFDDIVNTFEGVMVARGDLGMEIPTEKVFLAQKMIIRKCNIVGKPVITATQMLESMIKNVRPTRAEATDVANAVLDGTDCVMLSGETASGDHPFESVSIMDSICREAESVINYLKLHQALDNSVKQEAALITSKDTTVSKSRLGRLKVSLTESFASNAVKIQVDSDLKLILVLSDDAETVRLIAKYRPSCVVLYVTENKQLAAQVNGVCFAVYALHVKETTDIDSLIQKGFDHAKAGKWVNAGDKVVVVRKFKERETMQCLAVE